MIFHIDEDELEAYMEKQLRWHYESLKEDFFKSSKTPMYCREQEVDDEMTFNLINALRLVHNYMCKPSNKITWK